jgi:hypothetical protein
VFHYIIDKYAGERHKDKKQPFFERKMGDKPPNDILFIEPPNIITGKNNIPYDENNKHWKDRREEGFPTGIKMHSFVKTEDERGE